ncbi:hypothetical protein KSC_014430 [Ktedonobacter sp. SOSP1-52]|nr:hypothetical protein KSC_014430 [Ktedonobacter sp. SOSP1-52]
MNYVGGFWNLLNPYALLGGMTFVGLFTLHSALFLSLRTEGDVRLKAQMMAKTLWLSVTLLVFAFVIAGYVTTDVFTCLGINPGVAPLGAGAALLACGWLIYHRQSGWAFAMTGLTIILSTLTIFQGLYPRVMISSLNHAWDLTIYNASSSPYTLTVKSLSEASPLPQFRGRIKVFRLDLFDTLKP